jgi:hypothetical protein
VEPLNPPDGAYPRFTNGQVNQAVEALFQRAEKGRSSLIEAVVELDDETARALLVRQVIAVYATRLGPDDLKRWYGS